MKVVCVCCPPEFEYGVRRSREAGRRRRHGSGLECVLVNRKKGKGGRASESQRGDARGSDQQQQQAARQRQGDAINVIIEKSAVIPIHAVRECRTGPQTGQGSLHPEAPRRGEERVSD